MNDEEILHPAAMPTEKDLRQNFEAYQQFLEELDRRYQILGSHDILPLPESGETPFIVEPAFFYRTEAST